MERILITILTICFLSACSKEYYEVYNVNDSNIILASNFFPMAVGNEWIYKVSNCDNFEQNCTLARYDTVRIIADSIAGLDTFYLFSSSSLFFKKALKADSSILIDSEGNIKLSTDKSLESIVSYNMPSDSVMGSSITQQGYYHLLDDEFALYVPAGIFPVINFQGQLYSPLNNYSVKYYNNNYYSKNVGLVKFTYQYFNSQDVVKNELVSYNLNL